jgi:hypothetical protein
LKCEFFSAYVARELGGMGRTRRVPSAFTLEASGETKPCAEKSGDGVSDADR